MRSVARPSCRASAHGAPAWQRPVACFTLIQVHRFWQQRLLRSRSHLWQSGWDSLREPIRWPRRAGVALIATARPSKRTKTSKPGPVSSMSNAHGICTCCGWLMRAPGMHWSAGVEQIRCSGHFIPQHPHSYYREAYIHQADDYPIATDEFDHAVSLPMYSAMTKEQVERLVDVLSAWTDSPNSAGDRYAS